MAQKDEIKKAANFLHEVGTLRKIIRGHRQTLLTDDTSDNIASHSFRVAWIGWLLATMEKADANHVMLMCLLHDTPEARSGDQNWVHKSYVKVFEEEIIKDQIGGLPGEKKLKEVFDEYEKRETKEAKIAKDADLIDQILLVKEYIMIGNKEAVNWIKSEGKKGNRHYQLLATKSGRVLAKRIMKGDPADWWKDAWTDKRR